MSYSTSPIRVAGLVRFSRQVQEQLQEGIPAARLSEFRSRIEENVQALETGLRARGLTAADLPPPSRAAYEFLKAINLETLPIRSDEVTPVRQVRLANLRRLYGYFQGRVNQLAGTQPAGQVATALHPELVAWVGQVDRILESKGSGPHVLELVSGRAYALFQFLSDPSRLVSHVETVERFRRQALAAALKGTTGPPHVEMGFTGCVYALNGQRGIPEYRLHEGFLNAPDAVLAAVVRCLHRRQPEARREVNRHQLSEAFTSVSAELEAVLEPPEGDSRGRTCDLAEIFESVNRSYFDGAMPRPRLRWSARALLSKFGHYRFAADEVMISSLLDRPELPRFVVEFVLYHELLHKKHGQRLNGCRLSYHTPEFRADEIRFERYREAEEILNRMARHPYPCS
ncbi:MAG: M48 family metallopeptidase [Planctomycetes bacterium]|nr:M48 family metallopeptidase [Planctomycetota bacterium]